MVRNADTLARPSHALQMVLTGRQGPYGGDGGR